VGLKIKNSLFFAIVVLLFSSCGNSVLVDDFNTYDSISWPVSERYEIEFEQIDTITNYNFFISLRNTDAYPYRNIYIFLTTEFPDGRFKKDTINCPLANYRGKWLGKGFGGVYDNRIIYMQNTRFKQSGTYKITLEQAMRNNVLEGIKSVGIRVEESQ